jgi:hypothetical protein
MSGISNVGTKPTDVMGTMKGDPVDADYGTAPGKQDRQTSGAGAPPVVRETSASAVFVAPLPQPKANPASVDRLKAVLASDQPVDFARLILRLEEEQQKGDQQQLQSKVVELDNRKAAIKSNVERDLKKIEEAAKKLEAAKGWGIFGKIVRAFVVAFAVIGAVLTGGALVIGVAAVGAAVTVLEETGAMKKMFDAMGVSEDAQQWIMVGISAFLVVAGLGAAGMALKAASGAANAAGAAGAATIWSVVARQIAAGAQVAGGVAQVGEGATQVGLAVNQYQIAGIENDRKKIEMDNLKLKKQQEDLMQAVQELMRMMEENVQTAVQIVEDQDASFASIAENMRAVKT